MNRWLHFYEEYIERMAKYQYRELDIPLDTATDMYFTPDLDKAVYPSVHFSDLHKIDYGAEFRM